MPRKANIEQTFNYLLAEVLREKNPRWRKNGDLLAAEQKGVLEDRMKQLDLLVYWLFLFISKIYLASHAVRPS